MTRMAMAAVGVVLVMASGTRAAEERCTCPRGREYFLYAPDRAAPGPSWLVVGVHGYRGDGRGAAGLAPWAGRGDVVVVGPSFPDGYQGLGLESDAQLIGIFTDLRKRFELHPKLFIHGFSGGAQFAHRFALAHPDLVAGCSAHSGGTWEDSLNPAAVGVPFALSCGENDTGRSTPGSPRGRLDWFRTFVGRLDADSFSFKARTWPGVGHEASPEVARMTAECFRLATTGMHESELEAVRTEIARIDRLISAGRGAEARARIRILAERGATPAGTPASGREGTRGADPDDEFGWRLRPAGRDAVAAAREAFVRQATDELAARITARAIGAGSRPRASSH